MSDTPRYDAEIKKPHGLLRLPDLAMQLERENMALREALEGMLECIKGCEVFIHSRQKINQQEGPGWIASFTDKARAALNKPYAL